MLARRSRRVGTDPGFTLIELLISIAILGIIMVALTSMILSSLVASRTTEDELDAANALRGLSSVFENDVASASEVKTGIAAGCGSGTALVELRGTTFGADVSSTVAIDPAETAVVVSYVESMVTVSGADGRKLTRRVCTGGGAPVVSVVAPELAKNPPSTVVCSAGCNAVGSLISLTVTPWVGDAKTFAARKRTS